MRAVKLLCDGCGKEFYYSPGDVDPPYLKEFRLRIASIKLTVPIVKGQKTGYETIYDLCGECVNDLKRRMGCHNLQYAHQKH